MRISDWSADVCSSDLVAFAVRDRWHPGPGQHRADDGGSRHEGGDGGGAAFPQGPRAPAAGGHRQGHPARSEEHTSELQSLMRISYAVFGLKKKNTSPNPTPKIASLYTISALHRNIINNRLTLT